MKSFADKHKDSYMLRLSVKMLVGAINKDKAIVRAFTENCVYWILIYKLLMYTNVNIKEHETARKQQGRSGSATSEPAL